MAQSVRSFLEVQADPYIPIGLLLGPSAEGRDADTQDAESLAVLSDVLSAKVGDPGYLHCWVEVYAQPFKVQSV